MPEGDDDSYRLRDCLCQSCGDDCITVTRSEYCVDCEITALTTRYPCH